MDFTSAPVLCREMGDFFIVGGNKGYWKDGFLIIRQANVLIQDLPNYIGKLKGTEEWIAEAKFICICTYFALVKRYGGEHKFDSKYYFEKIPDGERKLNPLLEQNDRY